VSFLPLSVSSDVTVTGSLSSSAVPGEVPESPPCTGLPPLSAGEPGCVREQDARHRHRAASAISEIIFFIEHLLDVLIIAEQQV